MDKREKRLRRRNYVDLKYWLVPLFQHLRMRTDGVTTRDLISAMGMAPNTNLSSKIRPFTVWCDEHNRAVTDAYTLEKRGKGKHVFVIWSPGAHIDQVIEEMINS